MNICSVAQMCGYMDDLSARSQGNTFGGQIMHWMVPWCDVPQTLPVFPMVRC